MRKKFETSPHSRQPTPHRPDMRVMAFFLDVLSAMKESGNTNRVIPQSTAEPATPIWESVNPRAFCMAGNTEVTPRRAEKSSRNSMYKTTKANMKRGRLTGTAGSSTGAPIGVVWVAWDMGGSSCSCGSGARG